MNLTANATRTTWEMLAGQMKNSCLVNEHWVIPFPVCCLMFLIWSDTALKIFVSWWPEDLIMKGAGTWRLLKFLGLPWGGILALEYIHLCIHVWGKGRQGTGERQHDLGSCPSHSRWSRAPRNQTEGQKVYRPNFVLLTNKKNKIQTKKTVYTIVRLLKYTPASFASLGFYWLLKSLKKIAE